MISIMLPRDTERPHAREIEGHERLLTDDPGIVSGRDLEGRLGPDLELTAVRHPDMEATGQRDPDMVVLAKLRPGDVLDLLGPVPAWAEDHAPDDDVPRS